MTTIWKNIRPGQCQPYDHHGVWRSMGKEVPQSLIELQYRIILGPPKHVLHLVWSVLGISTAIKTALKVAPTGSSKWSINGKVKHYN